MLGAKTEVTFFFYRLQITAFGIVILIPAEEM
jgi:hypothetical protein